MSDFIHEALLMLWRQSWQLAILVLIVWPIAQLSQRRYPRFAYFLWFMVMIKSLLPIHIDTQTPAALNLGYLPMLNVSNLVVGAERGSSLSIEFILATLWAGIVLAILGKLILNEVRFHKALNNSQEFYLPQLSGLLEKFELTKQIRILRSGHVSVPQTLGFLNPVIIIPETQLTRDPEDLMPVIAHELAHIKRRDMLAISSQIIFSMLFFFHPLVHLINRQMDLNRERICDEMAMATLDLKPKFYGRELLTHLEASLQSSPQIIVSGGMFMTRKNVLKRFEYLMDGRGTIMLKIKHSQKLIIGLVVLVMLVMSCNEETTGAVTGSLPNEDNMVRRINPEDGSVSWVERQSTQEDEVVVEYDTPPEPLGGYAAIMNAVVYPELDRDSGVEGTVIVQVLIQKDGTTTNPKVLKGVPDSGLDQAALDAVKDLKWKPAMANDKAVTVRVSLPIVFRLDSK